MLAKVFSGAVLGVDTERSMSYQVFTLLLAAIALAVPFAFMFRPRLAVERNGEERLARLHDVARLDIAR